MALNQLAKVFGSGSKSKLDPIGTKLPGSRPISSKPQSSRGPRKTKIETDETYLGVNQILVYSLNKK